MTLVIRLESEIEFVEDSVTQERCYSQQKMNLNGWLNFDSFGEKNYVSKEIFRGISIFWKIKDLRVT